MSREEIMSEIETTIQEMKDTTSAFNGDILDACYIKNRIEILTDRLRDQISDYDDA